MYLVIFCPPQASIICVLATKIRIVQVLITQTIYKYTGTDEGDKYNNKVHEILEAWAKMCVCAIVQCTYKGLRFKSIHAIQHLCLRIGSISMLHFLYILANLSGNFTPCDGVSIHFRTVMFH